MLRCLYLLLLSVVLVSCGESKTKNQSETKQEDTMPPAVEVADEGKTYKEYILPGYEVLDTATGDLNRDQYPDMVLVLKLPDEEKAGAANPEVYVQRPLLLLLGTPGGNFTLAARNDKTVYCVNCGGMMGDPFVGITIKNGFFSVEHYGGSRYRWEYIVTYKYALEEKNWFLHKLGTVNTDVMSAEEGEDINKNSKETIKTTKDFGKVSFEDFDIYREEEK